jgi:TPR repeat protein
LAPNKPAEVKSGKAPAIAARLAGWSARGWRLLAATPRWQLAAGGGIAVALCVLVAVIAAGIGPFARTRQYPMANAPSDPAARLAYFQEGADAGDANSELQLGILYAKGDGAAQDYETAAKWFRTAANQGVARAQYDLGVLYERGRGVPLDLTEAANWYLKGAQGGHPLAQYNLAVCYIKGQGIRQDTAEGALWYRRAATQGVVQAMVNLAIMYEKGEGVAASPVDAYAWFLAAGRRDNQTAARHAEDLFATLAKNDQIRAQALASDVAASIHVPENGDKPVAAAAGGGH